MSVYHFLAVVKIPGRQASKGPDDSVMNDRPCVSEAIWPILQNRPARHGPDRTLHHRGAVPHVELGLIVAAHVSEARRSVKLYQVGQIERAQPLFLQKAEQIECQPPQDEQTI